MVERTGFIGLGMKIGDLFIVDRPLESPIVGVVIGFKWEGVPIIQMADGKKTHVPPCFLKTVKK